MRTLIIFSITFFSLFGLTTNAQINSNSLTPELSIELQPSQPQPGGETTATINDYSGGAYGASITWMLDGVEVPNSKNIRQIKFTAGDSGETQVLKAILSTPIVGNIVIQKNIKPVYLDVIIEPQTRTPDFYQGRSIPSESSTINATALLSGNGFRNSDLMYVWKVNNKVIDGGALRGRNQVSFTTPIGNSFVLSVEVSELDGTVITSRNIILPSVKPTLLFYEVSALFGVSEKAIDESLVAIGNNITVRGEPYYLDINTYNNPTISNWEVKNGNYAKVGSSPYEVSVQYNGANSQRTLLSFHVRDTQNLIQGAKGSIEIKF